MNKKRTFIDKVSDFVSGKGFYLVVLACVTAIALSGYYLVRGVQGSLSGEQDLPVTGSAAITVTPPPSVTQRPLVTAPPTARPSASPSAEPTPVVTEAPTQQPVQSNAPVSLVFTWPVKGSVIAPFSLEVLSYDETMGDWRTHDGLDVAAALGTQVIAAANGTVSDVYQDDLMGTTVVIDHGNGLTSVYSNLAEVPTVAAGDTVTTGAVLGSVGSTAAAESGRAAHLHFAMYRDGVPVDPENYLPEK